MLLRVTPGSIVPPVSGVEITPFCHCREDKQKMNSHPDEEYSEESYPEFPILFRISEESTFMMKALQEEASSMYLLFVESRNRTSVKPLLLASLCAFKTYDRSKSLNKYLLIQFKNKHFR